MKRNVSVVKLYLYVSVVKLLKNCRVWYVVGHTVFVFICAYLFVFICVYLFCAGFVIGHYAVELACY